MQTGRCSEKKINTSILELLDISINIYICKVSDNVFSFIPCRHVIQNVFVCFWSEWQQVFQIMYV